MNLLSGGIIMDFRIHYKTILWPKEFETVEKVG